MSRRTDKINDLIRDELSELILREVRDPRLGGLISIIRVEVTPDLNNSRVFVSIMSSPEEQAESLRALNAAAAYFHRELKSRIDMRRIPFLAFKLDTSIQEGAELLELIAKVTHGDENAATRSEALSESGLLIVDKPLGWTSSDVVGFVRRRSRIKKVGHTGTLDPAATGVLPLCLGQATRLSQYLVDAGKTYLATIELGVETTTYDSEGDIVSRAEMASISEADIENALKPFIGEIEQKPPAYSAIKRQGVPLYKLARRGENVDVPARLVQVDELVVLDYTPPILRLEIDCGKGFYVRSLAHDLGQQLGIGGMLSGLVRTRVGRFRVEEAVQIETLESELESGDWRERLYAPDEVLLDWQALLVGQSNEARLRKGQTALVVEDKLSDDAGLCRAYGREGALVAILRRVGVGEWQPDKVFDSIE